MLGGQEIYFLAGFLAAFLGVFAFFAGLAAFGLAAALGLAALAALGLAAAFLGLCGPSWAFRPLRAISGCQDL